MLNCATDGDDAEKVSNRNVGNNEGATPPGGNFPGATSPEI